MHTKAVVDVSGSEGGGGEGGGREFGKFFCLGRKRLTWGKGLLGVVLGGGRKLWIRTRDFLCNHSFEIALLPFIVRFGWAFNYL